MTRPAATFLQAAINGARTPDEHPRLPVSPAQLAAAALDAVRAGAQAVHLHPKTPDGRDSLLPGTVAAAVSAVREVLPDIPLGVTTGYWALPDARERLAAIGSWDVVPDFASVNWHEPGSPELAELLLSKGIGVEAGIFHAEAAAAWAASDLAVRCLRVMVELEEDADATLADQLLDQVRAADAPAPILLHGLDAGCWPLLRHAGVRGVQTRIGLEDTLALPDGAPASGNAELVAAALHMLN